MPTTTANEEVIDRALNVGVRQNRTLVIKARPICIVANYTEASHAFDPDKEKNVSVEQ